MILSPSLISARAVQLVPAYTGGPELADDAVIPLPYGIHDVRATATDPAGNASSDATTAELEIVRSLVSVSGPESVVVL